MPEFSVMRTNLVHTENQGKQGHLLENQNKVFPSVKKSKYS